MASILPDNAQDLLNVEKKDVLVLTIPCYIVQSASCHPNHEQSKDGEPCEKASNESRNNEAKGSRLSFVTDVKGLLQIAEVDVYSTDCSEQVLVLCDLTCSHFWISEKLVEKFKLQGPPTTLTVRGINSQLKNPHPNGWIQVDSRSFGWLPCNSQHQALCEDIGTDIIDVTKLKQQYPHLKPLTLSIATWM